MIYKHMYIGYKKSGKIEFLDNKELITSSAATFEDVTVVYFESKNPDVSIDDVVSGDMIPFPDGNDWFETTEIFNYYTPDSDEQWVRKIENKTPHFRINKLNRNKIASYIYYHVDHQHTNQINCDKFLSIFNYSDMIFMYSETPSENVLWSDIEDKYHEPENPRWAEIMDEHFKAWPDGKKGWLKMENE